MNWIRHEEGFKSLHTTMGMALIFLMLAVIYAQFMLAACFAMILVIAMIQNLYYKNVAKDLVLIEQKVSTKFMIGAVSNVTCTFQNGDLPIWGGILTVSIEDAVEPVGNEVTHFSRIYDVEIPISMKRNEQVEVTIPLVGKHRGLSRITRMMIEIPHLFGEGAILLELKDQIYVENIVYPKITALDQSLIPSAFKLGELAVRQSLFYDALQPIGTRDYVPTDRFDQIHWAASAKMQTLQTKEYAPVTERSITFIVNVIEQYKSEEDFERKIERLTAYVHYCHTHHIPYDVHLNFKTYGHEPYLLQASSVGKVHYQQTLEMLARISERNAKIPFEAVLRNIDTANHLSPTMVLITHDTEKYQAFVHKWRKFCEVIVDEAEELEVLADGA